MTVSAAASDASLKTSSPAHCPLVLARHLVGLHQVTGVKISLGDELHQDVIGFFSVWVLKQKDFKPTEES